MEIVVFCGLYSAVLLGALAYTLDFNPTPQPAIAQKESNLMRRHGVG